MATEIEKTNAFVRSMLESRTLGQETISRHGTDGAIFDDENLALLREYCANPADKEAFLRKHGMLDTQGAKVGSRGKATGSLVGYAIATGALTDQQAGLLREWFEKDMPSSV